MDKIEVATIITSSSDHTCIIPQSEEIFKEEFFYSKEGRPSECFSFCRFQVNIGIREESKEWMSREKMSEVDYIHKYGKDFSTFAFVTNSSVPYLRELPEYRGSAYPSGRSPYVSPENEYSLLSVEERNRRYPKVAWGMAAVFVWDLLYEDDKQDFRLMCDDHVLMQSYYNNLLKEYLILHNTRRYNHLTDADKEYEFLVEYIKQENNLWMQTKTSLCEFKTIYNYTEDFMKEYFDFLNNKLKSMTEAQKKNDEKYVKLLMHYMNVFVMQEYFERGPQRIDHRVVDIYDYWARIINSPDFKIYDAELLGAIKRFFESWNSLMKSAGLYYSQSNTPTDYVFAEGRAEFEMLRTKDEEDFFDDLVAKFPTWFKLFTEMLEAIKDRYVIDFDDIDETLWNPGYKNGKEEVASQPETSDFYNCHVYVSYPWSDSVLMDDICRCLKMRKIDYFRDKDICGFRKNIQKFEEEIGNGKIVIAIINEQSMESIDCMYEVCTLARNGHLDKRLFPIVDLPNMKRDSKACEDYLKKREEKEKEILVRYTTSPGEKVNELRELKYINCIKTEFPKFWNYISKYNTSTLESLQEDDWKILMDEVEQNISE